MRKRKLGKEDIKYYRLCAFPLMGAVIGILLYAFSTLCVHFGFGYTCFAFIASVIPLLINGGAFLKGFMDTSEAIAISLFSHMRPEEKKDNVVGVHAVTAVIVYFMLYAGGMSVVWKEEQLVLLGIGYIISGTLYSMTYVWFSKTEKPPMPAAQKRALRIILSIILALCFCTCIAISPIMGVLEALLCMWVWTYYYYMSKRIFGKITDSSAGYFLLLCELAVVLFVGLFGRVLC